MDLSAQTSFADAVATFLAFGDVANHTPATHRTYAYVLERFRRTCDLQTIEDLTQDAIQRHLMDLRARMRPISVHQPFRTLRTFCRWCVRTGRLAADPMAGLAMKVPKTLPRVPGDEDVRRLLAVCPNTFEGRRNRVLIALAADAGLRKEEIRYLRIGDVDFTTRMIRVHAGKGQKDGVTFFGEATVSILKSWLAAHPDPRPAAFVLCSRDGAQLGPFALVRILHRLSRRAELDRKIGPHALRHYAATAILRRTGDLELVRRVLRHESLTMTLRYVTLAQADVAMKFLHASPLDNLRAGSTVTKRESATRRGYS